MLTMPMTSYIAISRYLDILCGHLVEEKSQEIIIGKLKAANSHCDFKIGVTFGYNEMWLPPAVRDCFV